jgi:hypothetical protein
VRAIHSYVVRVYRRDAEALAGLVEDVQTARTAPFRSLAELCDVIAGHKRLRRRAAPRNAALPADAPARAPADAAGTPT